MIKVCFGLYVALICQYLEALIYIHHHDLGPETRIAGESPCGSPFADGELIAKSVTGGPIQWNDGFSFKKLTGKESKLRFELRESKL